MPHGRSWKVLKPRVFETSVLPVFFESDNYHSFNRVINAWSFRRKSTGPDRGSYFHELFLRGKPHLQKYMRRLPRTHKKLTMSESEEPDFFELENTSPLPTLEQARVNLESRKFLRLREHYEKESIIQHDNDNNNDNGTVHEQIIQSVQTKQRQEYLKHVDAWHHENGGGPSRQQAIKDMGTSNHANEYNGHGIHGIHRTTKNFEVLGMLFQIQQTDDDIKDEESRDLCNTLVVGGKSSQADAVRHIEAEAVTMRQIEQDQYLRARGMRQQLALHQHHHHHQQQQQQQSHMIRQADLLRQMDILQASSSQAQQN
jgi:ribosomal protein S9